jgi:hypothetical protein
VTLNYEDMLQRSNTPDVNRLLAANPLGQLPTLLTPEGVAITEMAAMVLCKCFVTAHYTAVVLMFLARP